MVLAVLLLTPVSAGAQTPNKTGFGLSVSGLRSGLYIDWLDVKAELYAGSFVVGLGADVVLTPINTTDWQDVQAWPVSPCVELRQYLFTQRSSDRLAHVLPFWSLQGHYHRIGFVDNFGRASQYRLTELCGVFGIDWDLEYLRISIGVGPGLSRWRYTVPVSREYRLSHCIQAGIRRKF